jgi:hypothetical protein
VPSLTEFENSSLEKISSILQKDVLPQLEKFFEAPEETPVCEESVPVLSPLPFSLGYTIIALVMASAHPKLNSVCYSWLNRFSSGPWFRRQWSLFTVPGKRLPGSEADALAPTTSRFDESVSGSAIPTQSDYKRASFGQSHSG